MKRGYWIVIILIITLFGIWFLSDKISESGLIEPVNDSIVEGVGVVCEQHSDCKYGLRCVGKKCEDTCGKCGNSCDPDAYKYACIVPTENFECKTINGVCKKITGELVCGDGVCEIPEIHTEICAPCAVPAPRPCPCSPNPKYCPQDCEKRK